MAILWQKKAKLSLPRRWLLATPPTLVGAALFFSCLGGTVATVVAEREQQTIKRLFLSPLSGVSYFILHVLSPMCDCRLSNSSSLFLIAKQYGATFKGSIPLELLSYFS